ncbi:MAG: protoheme IX farnesyltransferase [Acidobacteria bacterium]|nr:protoheme IX farnesyltransferase [Acidobacteriota bacterium]
MAVAEAPALPVLLDPDRSKARAAGRGRVVAACSARASAYLELAKPEVTFLVLVAAGLGFAMATPGLDLPGLMRLLLGTGLLAAGTAALNHCLEWSDDARMRRTVRRPIPSGRVALREGYSLGLASALGGTACLALGVSPLAGLIGLTASLAYLGGYTPLKRRTAWCTFVGAFPGAAPVLIGWTAAASLSVEAWVLFAILFLWQFPHFIAIAWMYREDYARAGLVMLPRGDAGGRRAFRQIMGYSMALVPASLAPYWLGMAGSIYLAAAFCLGAGFLYYAWRAYAQRTKQQARLLLHVTVIYLPLLYLMMVLDKG